MKKEITKTIGEHIPGEMWDGYIYCGAGIDSYRYLIESTCEQDALDCLADDGAIDRFLVDENQMSDVQKDYLADYPEDTAFENLEEHIDSYLSYPIRLGNAGELFDMQILKMERV